MNKPQRTGLIKSGTRKKGSPIFRTHNASEQEKPIASVNLQSREDLVEEPSAQETYESTDREAFNSKVERFIEISKHFSSPLHKTASYLSDHTLVSYPSSLRVEYKRGGVVTEHIKFCNLVLEPIYVKLFKLVPDLEQIKYINLSLSRSKRIPPGLSFNLGFVYDDVNEKPAVNAKIIFVASRKTTTPCYQVCEINLQIDVQKNRKVDSVSFF
ncbi:hypothetical protein OBRU01_20745 [Operophtera brumata]|uniref:Uncharacterized protein n=1 Tax=Operophtera brumata TaxID=104452 RepID=A0A0L7KUV0_OPEBR|nr:hypothetical protein OBRU01_20745 [Operophtera brumata]